MHFVIGLDQGKAGSLLFLKKKKQKDFYSLRFYRARVQARLIIKISFVMSDRAVSQSAQSNTV
jgi:hypothetical protein